MRGLTDSELVGLTHESLLAWYRELRDHHAAVVTRHEARDRSAILRMAGNIAGGYMADPTAEFETVKDVAECAVSLARAIIAEVDGHAADYAVKLTREIIAAVDGGTK